MIIMNTGPTRSRCLKRAFAFSIRARKFRDVRMAIPMETSVTPKPSEKTRIIRMPYPIFPKAMAAKRTAMADGQGMIPPENDNQKACHVWERAWPGDGGWREWP